MPNNPENTRTFQDIIIYLKMSLKAFVSKPNWNTFNSAIIHFLKWKQYIVPNHNVIQPMPWISFGAIQYIKKIISPEMVVFEFGSGGSTKFWSMQVSKVISVEHDTEWYQRMLADFKSNNIQNVEYYLIPSEIDADYDNKNITDPGHYISDDENFKGNKFESYARKIDEFPDEFFDLVIVDGRARPSCIAHAVNKIKHGGYLVLDNSEREYYHTALKQYTMSWKKYDFMGPVPYNYNFSQTSFLKKP